MCDSVERDALVVVDAVEAFADPLSPEYIAGGEQIIPVVGMLVSEALRKGIPVIFARSSDRLWCSEFDSVAPAQFISSSNLSATIAALNVNNVVVVGLGTDEAVKMTVLELLDSGFYVQVIHEGIRARNVQPNDGREARRAMIDAGAEIVKLLGGVFTQKVQAPTDSLVTA